MKKIQLALGIALWVIPWMFIGCGENNTSSTPDYSVPVYFNGQKYLCDSETYFVNGQYNIDACLEVIDG